MRVAPAILVTPNGGSGDDCVEKIGQSDCQTMEAPLVFTAKRFNAHDTPHKETQRFTYLPSKKGQVA